MRYYCIQISLYIVRNDVKRLPRHIIAGLLALIFVGISLSPLAKIGMHSSIITQAIPGECSGDCDTCGCSPERRASHSCCCWLNKRKNHDKHDEQVADCCKKNSKVKTSAISGYCPCGSAKQFSLWGKEELQLLPYNFNGGITLLREDRFFHHSPLQLVGRSIKPPVPPPELSIRL